MHLERRVLVTGGAGFRMSHLAEQLMARWHQMLRVDNFFTSTGLRRTIPYFEDLLSQGLLKSVAAA